MNGPFDTRVLIGANHGCPGGGVRSAGGWTVGAVIAVVAAMVCVTACADDTTDGGGDGGGGQAGTATTRLVAIGTDYAASAVSSVDLATSAALASTFLHSGTAVATISTALSGDVVASSNPTPDGRLLLIDRANAVLTWVRDLEVEAQMNVGTGFYANPQDALQTDASHMYVVRGQSNPAATADAGDLDEGDDLLVVDPAAGAAVSRIDLHAHATLAGANAFGGRLGWDGQRVWVPLGSVAPDFMSMGKGRLVAVDVAAGAVVATVDLPQSKNCTEAVWLAASNQVAVVCSGSFQETVGIQADFSNIVIIDAAAEPPTAALAVKAAATGTGRPFGAHLGLIDAASGLVATTGDFGSGAPDLIWRVDLTAGAVHLAAAAGGAFAIGGLFADRARQRIWVAETGHAAGDLRVFDLSGAATPTELPAVSSNPGGLGAWELGSY